MSTTTDGALALAEIRGLARDFAAAELRPHVERWDHEGALPDSTVAQLAELGFFGMLVPEAHGGMGFDAATFVAAVEELAWGEPAVALLVVAHAVPCAWLDEAGGAVADDWLPALAAGDRIATTSIAGPVASDHPAGARADWLPRGGRAQLALTRTREGERLAVALEGATFDEPAPPMGLRPLELRHARAADGRRLEVAASAAAGAAADRAARLGAAAIATGIASAALDHARGYAAERHQFGRAIRTFEGIAGKLAEMRVRTAGARALTAVAGTQPVHAQESATAAAEAKICAADAAVWVTTQAVQVYGGYGYMRDYPVEKLMRDAMATALLFDDNDMLRLWLADEMYRG